MYKTDGHGALAHGRSHTVHGPCAHVACGKHTGAAGLEQVRVALLLPYLIKIAVELKVAPGFYKALVVLNNVNAQPVGKRLGTYKDVQGVGRLLANLACGKVLNIQMLQLVAATCCSDLGFWHYV